MTLIPRDPLEEIGPLLERCLAAGARALEVHTGNGNRAELSTLINTLMPLKDRFDLIAFSLGVMNSVAEPLARRRSNPVTAVALTGALISGAISMGLVLRAMVTPSPLA